MAVTGERVDQSPHLQAPLVHPPFLGGSPGALSKQRRSRRSSTPTPTRWGMLRLRTIGRRTGEERSAILGYYEDGPNLVTLAMNGWAEGEPAWWLNLQARPDAIVDLVDGPRTGHGARRRGRRTRAPLGRVARRRGRRRRLRAIAVLRDGGRGPWLRPADRSQTHTAGGPAATTGEKRMSTNRRIAVVAGVAFLIATMAQLVGSRWFPQSSAHPVDLTKISANENQFILGAFFQFVGALACPAIAIALYPVLRRYSEGLALGSVGFGSSRERSMSSSPSACCRW